MTWDTSRTGPVRGKLARHLGRLQQHLDAVGEQVREAIANAVGRTVAEAVGEAVYDALCPRDGSFRSLPPSSSSYGHAATPRRAWEESDWPRDAARSPWRDPYGYDDYAEARYDDDPEGEDTSSLADEPRVRRWRRALAAGLQAASWWLRRHPGQVSLVAALAVGCAAGLTVLAGHVSGIASVVLSALGLAYLLDLMRSANSLLGRDVTP